MAERCGQYNKNNMDGRVDKCDVLGVLLGIVSKYINPDYSPSFTDFISDVAPTNSWKVGYYTKQSIIGWGTPDQLEKLPDYDYWTAIVMKSMSVLRLLELKTIEKMENAKIGEPDFELFPMFKK